jgi:co-chaperonin GroES (HSP10)
MATIYEARPMTIRAIRDDVIVIDMDMGDQITASGIVIQSDDGKAHGVKPRWCKVYKVGPRQHTVKEGQWILVEHGRWTRKVKIDDGDGVKEIQKVEVKSILASSDIRPADVYLGKEYGHGDSATIRPEDFGAR